MMQEVSYNKGWKMSKIALIVGLMITSLQAMYHPALKNKLVSFDDKLLERVEMMKANPINTKVWLLVIGVEKYDVTDDIIFSTNSAKLFAKIAIKRFGVTPRRQYILIGDDASSAKIKDTISMLANNVQKGDTIIFYYSGHGIPSFPAKEPYILPKDKDPAYVTADSDLKLANIYKKLQTSPAKKIIALVDACFSGATDNKSLFKGVAAPRIRAKQIKLDSTKIAVLTAGKDKEFSNKYSAKHHRLFSYFLIDEILNGATNMKSLYKKVEKDVTGVSFEFGDSFKQTPTFTGNANLSF